MIPAMKSIDESIKVIRQMIIRQSQLPSDRVLNGMSIRGVNLSKRITELVSTSINVKDCIIVFSLHNRFDETDISQYTDLGLESVVNLEFKMTIYGDDSLNIASKLKARLESSKCRTDLYNEGVNFQKISNIEEINEFMNETAWHRCDMSIEFEIRLEVEEIDEEVEFKDFELTVESANPTMLTDYNAIIEATRLSSTDFVIESPILLIE